MNLRIAPSPTGELHLGNLYVFIANLIFSKKNDLPIILRFDDTDKKRNKSNEKSIKNILKRLDFKIEKIVFQSKRKKIYKEIINKMLENSFAFYCSCKKEDEICICKYNQETKKKKQDAIKINSSLIIRKMKECTSTNNKFSIAKDEIVINNISFNTSIIKDFFIVRSDGTYLYHICSCIDDILLNISTIIRAEEWITSLWKHAILFYAINKITNLPIPNIEHVTLILDKNGKKLSKRENSLSIEYLLDELMIEKESLKVYLYSLLVKKSSLEIYKNEEEFIFDVLNQKEKEMFLCTKESFNTCLNKSKPATKFDIDKLLYFNKKIIQLLPEKIEEIMSQFVGIKKLRKIFTTNTLFLDEMKRTFNVRKDLYDYFFFIFFSDEEIIEKIKENKKEINEIVKVLIEHKNIIKKNRALISNEKGEIEYRKYKELFLIEHSEEQFINHIHLIRFAFIFKEKGLSMPLLFNSISENAIQSRINKFNKLK